MPNKKKTETEIPEEKSEEKILEKAAEIESLAIEDPSLAEKGSKQVPASSVDIAERKKKILEKVKKLKSKVEVTSTEEMKEEVKVKKKTEMLVPLDEYVKDAIYLGTKIVTPDMRPFIYRRRADGLAIFNTDLVDEKLKEASEFLNKFDAKDIVLVCKRNAGWKTAEMLGKLTGIRVFTKKYPAGILTNSKLKDFFENELTIVCDSWLDRNALKDTLGVRKKVLMICDTNNHSRGASKIIIGNNKSPRSLGLMFYILAKEFCKAKGLDTDKMPDLKWWTEEAEEAIFATAGVSSIREKGAKFGV